MQKILSFILVFFLLASPLATAHETGEVHEHEENVSDADNSVLTEVVQQSSLLLQLKQKLAQIQFRFTLLQQNVESAKVSILDLDAVIANLESVIASLDEQIKDANKQILDVKSQKERKSMEVEALEEDIQILELQLEDQKVLVGELMTLLYVKRDIYFDEEGVNPVKVLASSGSVSETLQKITYLDLIEAENQSQIDKMATLSTNLSGKWGTLRIKKEELEKLDTRLAEELIRLEGERQAQQDLLDEMMGERAVLEAMLESADQREDELLKEIKIYEKNVKMMEEKLASSSGLLSEDQKALIEKIQQEMLENFEGEEAADFVELDWPISPGRGITAFFHDENYIGLFGTDHYALDLRAYTGTTIFTPADGVVQNVVFDPTSTKYAYILIAHRKGVMTLYGHISATAVAVGDYVTRGQVIGFTGGSPKSIGAGVRTTGPHLHFEVWQDGVRVDPLRYLPLSEVPLEMLPEEYLDNIQSILEEQIKEIQAAMGL